MPHDPDEAPIGFCAECRANCLAVWRDQGIGSYEYWGNVEFNADWRWVSPCCGAEVAQPNEEEDDES